MKDIFSLGNSGGIVLVEEKMEFVKVRMNYFFGWSGMMEGGGVEGE